MSMSGWSVGSTPVPAPVSDRPGLGQAFAATAGVAVSDLAGTEDFDVFTVARMTDRSWTGVTSRSRTGPALVGHPVPVEQSACHHLLVGRRPVLARDLRRHTDPELRAVGRQHGVSAYVGAPLRRFDGQLLGSVCGYSAARWTGVDHDRLAARLALVADALGRELATALDAVVDDRRAGIEQALRSRDDVTGLPDRRGWGLLLHDEAERAVHLAEDLSVVLVDIGLVRTARGLRRAGHVLREALGEVALSRVGGRQFGVVGGDLDDLDPGATAVLAQDALRAAGYTATAGWAVREPQEDVVGTWRRAEDALLRVRAGRVSG